MKYLKAAVVEHFEGVIVEYLGRGRCRGISRGDVVEHLTGALLWNTLGVLLWNIWGALLWNIWAGSSCGIYGRGSCRGISRTRSVVMEYPDGVVVVHLEGRYCGIS